MSVPREQFDSLLGGKEQLPTAVSIMRFVEARSQEISALTEAIEEPQNNHLAFQKMPKHLRRRVMSHNVKRMPRRLQEVHLSQLEKSGLPVKGKRPSRKYRRRPWNLLQEYNRRQRVVSWLETHIWHAKRFHMTQQWGYKLPLRSTDKAFRACYRATARHCLVQDVSYLNCIELRGPEDDILQGLSLLTNVECGLTFAAKATLSGCREGSVTVFKQEGYPDQALGRVTFLWRPERDGNNRTLWIWCHPAFYDSFLHELISAFQLTLAESEMDVDPDEVGEVTGESKATKCKKADVEKVKLETKNVGKLPKYTNKSVAMTLLKDTLNRFRLTGPLAQVVLTEALKFVDIKNFLKTDSSKGKMMDLEPDESARSAWLSDFYDNTRLSSLKQQCDFWVKTLPDINSASELPPRIVVAATVMDPRLSMPSTRSKAVYSGVTGLVAEVPSGISCNSPLWETTLRDAVTHSKMATAQLNELRSRALVPGLGTDSWLGSQHVSHLPILLVQNTGTLRGENHCGYGSGWDVIVPTGWGMPVWLGLVFRGARPGGLRETERLTLETAIGPTLPPDTPAGCSLSKLDGRQRQDKHFRLPPDKRPNYIKLGVVSPFHCLWETLVQDWRLGEKNQYPTGGVYVIRSRAKLDYLRCLFNRTKPLAVDPFTEGDRARGLVQVGVEMCGRGTLGSGSMICLLSKKDLKLAKEKSGRGPTEPLHEDGNEEKRKKLREAHLARLKRLRKKRLRVKRELEEKGLFLPKTKSKPNPTEEVVRQQAELMRELWLPSEVKNVKNSSSRYIMGFVTHGDYSFTQSKCYGYGFVALSALISYFERNQSQILVRNVTSLQYYFAKLKLMAPV